MMQQRLYNMEARANLIALWWMPLTFQNQYVSSAQNSHPFWMEKINKQKIQAKSSFFIHMRNANFNNAKYKQMFSCHVFISIPHIPHAKTLGVCAMFVFINRSWEYYFNSCGNLSLILFFFFSLFSSFIWFSFDDCVIFFLLCAKFVHSNHEQHINQITIRCSSFVVSHSRCSFQFLCFALKKKKKRGKNEIKYFQKRAIRNTQHAQQ